MNDNRGTNTSEECERASSTTITRYLSHITNDTDDSKPPDATLPSRIDKTLDLPCLPMHSGGPQCLQVRRMRAGARAGGIISLMHHVSDKGGWTITGKLMH